MADGTVFLAFAQADRQRATEVASALERAGLSPWTDADLRAGENWELTIAEQLRSAAVVVVLVSRDAAQSVWVDREVEYAKASQTPVVPLLLEGDPLPSLAHLQHVRLPDPSSIPPDALNAIRDAVQRRAPVARSAVVQGVLDALDNRKLGSVLEELQETVVLLLGNFSGEHLDRLLRLQAELQRRGHYPVIFDFERPMSSDYGETVRLLAGLASFVLADMSDPRSVVMELQLIVPDLAVPVVPVIGELHIPVALFADLVGKYDWVLPAVRYRSVQDLVDRIDDEIIAPAQRKRQELNERKRAATAAQVGVDRT